MPGALMLNSPRAVLSSRFSSRHRQPGMRSYPIDGVFLGGEFSKVVHSTIWPYYLHTPNLALSHRQ